MFLLLIRELYVKINLWYKDCPPSWHASFRHSLSRMGGRDSRVPDHVINRTALVGSLGYSAAMTKSAQPKERGAQPKQVAQGRSPKTGPKAGYDEWLAVGIEAGHAELDAGKKIAAKTVWIKLDLYCHPGLTRRV